MSNQKNTGTTDKSTQKDLFKITSYINGLSDFISKCNTPMTVAIQGDWGSGKTSLMEMVQNELSADIIKIDINTWQYSQFEFDEKLSIVFLQSLIEQLAKDKKGNINPIIKTTLYEIASSMAVLSAGVFGGANGSKLAEKAINSISDSSAVQVIDRLKFQFEEIIQKRCEEENKSRVIFFIDDLDRLQPEKAVELMEVLKIFLDCEKCVFVLAIDYKVVSQGVKSKYKGMDDTKARSFFDKIIQVPFTMPVGRYNISNYIAVLLEQSELHQDFLNDNNDKGIDETFVDLIRYTVGSNPRSIKRLINTYALLISVASSQSEWKGKKEFKRVLFATICGQLSYENLYNYLLELSFSKDELKKLLTDVRSSDENALRKNTVLIEKLGLSESSDFYVNEIIDYVDKLVEIVNNQCKAPTIEDNYSNEISDDALLLLIETLQMSATTATNLHLDNNAVNELDAKITYIHDVVKKCILNTNGDYNKLDRSVISKSMKECAAEYGVSNSTIADKCHRLLGCKTEDFEKLCKEFLHNDREKLISKVIFTNKNKKISTDKIREIFMSL